MTFCLDHPTVTTVAHSGYGHPDACLRIDRDVASTVCTCIPCLCPDEGLGCRPDCAWQQCNACWQSSWISPFRTQVLLHPHRGADEHQDVRPVGCLTSHFCNPEPSHPETAWGLLMGNWNDWDHPLLPAVGAWTFYAFAATGALLWHRPNSTTYRTPTGGICFDMSDRPAVHTCRCHPSRPRVYQNNSPTPGEYT
jgi:hypothetical protein